MGKLYVVPTPIGNLKDITLRALDVLRNVNTIACEDTRRTRILLNHYQIGKKRLISYYEPKEQLQIPKIMKALKEEDVALVSDAGMPAISDPGYRLLKRCVEEGIEVEVLPGASALITAVVGSALPTDRFTFLGFPPKKGVRGFFEELTHCEETTFVLYESPKRAVKTLKVILDVFGNVEACLCRELTKVHEEYIRGCVAQLIEYIENRDSLKGEVVIVFNPKLKGTLD